MRIVSEHSLNSSGEAWWSSLVVGPIPDSSIRFPTRRRALVAVEIEAVVTYVREQRLELRVLAFGTRGTPLTRLDVGGALGLLGQHARRSPQPAQSAPRAGAPPRPDGRGAANF